MHTHKAVAMTDWCIYKALCEPASLTILMLQSQFTTNYKTSMSEHCLFGPACCSIYDILATGWNAFQFRFVAFGNGIRTECKLDRLNRIMEKSMWFTSLLQCADWNACFYMRRNLTERISGWSSNTKIYMCTNHSYIHLSGVASLMCSTNSPSELGGGPWPSL